MCAFIAGADFGSQLGAGLRQFRFLKREALLNEPLRLRQPGAAGFTPGLGPALPFLFLQPMFGQVQPGAGLQCQLLGIRGQTFRRLQQQQSFHRHRFIPAVSRFLHRDQPTFQQLRAGQFRPTRRIGPAENGQGGDMQHIGLFGAGIGEPGAAQGGCAQGLPHLRPPLFKQRLAGMQPQRRAFHRGSAHRQPVMQLRGIGVQPRQHRMGDRPRRRSNREQAIQIAAQLQAE